MRRKAVPISIRMDEQTLQWFKEQRPKGYQTLINEVLDKFAEDRRKLDERRAGRAQEIFRQYYPVCFWHFNRDLVITPQNIGIVTEGLKEYGGREGLLLAEELCQ